MNESTPQFVEPEYTPAVAELTEPVRRLLKDVIPDAEWAVHAPYIAEGIDSSSEDEEAAKTQDEVRIAEWTLTFNEEPYARPLCPPEKYKVYPNEVGTPRLVTKRSWETNTRTCSTKREETTTNRAPCARQAPGCSARWAATCT